MYFIMYYNVKKKPTIAFLFTILRAAQGIQFKFPLTFDHSNFEYLTVNLCHD